MIHASEDVGLADNTALQTAVAAAQAVEKIGYPEAQIVLAHAALHVARAPKSMSACRGIMTALQFVAGQPPAAVPMHLRDTHYKGQKRSAMWAISCRMAPRAAGWNRSIPRSRAGRCIKATRDAATFEKRADDYWQSVTGQAQPQRDGK